jgi:hypothetical protein
MSSAQSIVSSRMVIRRESAIRSRISRGQRQLAGAVCITVRYALVGRSGQENLLRAPGPQIVHEGRVRGILRIGGYGGSQTSTTFVMQSSMEAGDFKSCLRQGNPVSCFRGCWKWRSRFQS